MTVRKAIEVLAGGLDMSEIPYPKKVLSMEIPKNYTPVRFGRVKPKENYMGLNSGSLYTNTTGAMYNHLRLVVKKVHAIDYCLEE